MTPLSSRLKAALAFDFLKGVHAESNAWKSPQCESLKGHKSRNYFTSGAIVGASIENARLQPLHEKLIKVVKLFELECEKQACVCKLNPYVGGLVPCETCRMREALAELRETVTHE